jgi:hypothetical protein
MRLSPGILPNKRCRRAGCAGSTVALPMQQIFGTTKRAGAEWSVIAGSAGAGGGETGVAKLSATGGVNGLGILGSAGGLAAILGRVGGAAAEGVGGIERDRDDGDCANSGLGWPENGDGREIGGGFGVWACAGIFASGSGWLELADGKLATWLGSWLACAVL